MGTRRAVAVAAAACALLLAASPVSAGEYSYAHQPEPAPAPEKTCYKTGERVKGAPGYPYVPYLAGCCSPADAPQAGDGWGEFCSPSRGGSYTAPAPAPAPAPVYAPASGGNCHSAGQRCAGAPGYAAVQVRTLDFLAPSAPTRDVWTCPT
jgi:hypothetical protein